MADQTVIISVLADVARFSNGLRGAVGTFGKFAAGVTAGAVAVGYGLFKMSSVAVKAASDFEQSMGGVESVFKDQASKIAEYAEGAANRIGLSMNSYNEVATLTGTLLKNAGTPMKQLAGETDVLVTRAADLAATFGGSVEEAATAMNAALRGEFEPIRKFGISLSQAQIQEKALSMTHKTSISLLSRRDKLLATQKLLMEQSADAAGQFAREEDSLAGAQARLDANLENIQKRLGDALIPLFKDVTSAFLEWIQSEDTQRFFQDIVDGITIFVEAMQEAFNDPAVKETFTRLNNGLKKFIEYLKSPEGRKAAEEWANGIGQALSAVAELLMFLLWGVSVVAAAMQGDWGTVGMTYNEWKDKYFPKLYMPSTPSTGGKGGNTSNNNGFSPKPVNYIINFNSPQDPVAAGKEIVKTIAAYNRSQGVLA